MPIELDHVLRQVLFGATLLGAVGGLVGVFAVLRRQSLVGDALAHAALPGVCIAFLLTGTKSTLPLSIGALVAGVIGASVIVGIVRLSRVKEDAAIGIVLSVFFGVGIVLLTFIQRLPGGNQSGLDVFLFGQAATLVQEDVLAMLGVALAVLALVLVFYKELGLLIFDRDFAASIGLPVRALELLVTLMIVVVVVVGLRTVGVILVVATLVTPAAAARQWTERLGVMLALAALFGGLSGALGALSSSAVARLPTGPTVVLFASAILVVSLLFAPERGLVWARLRERAARRRILRENLLRDLWRTGEHRGRFFDPASVGHLMGLRGLSAARVRKVASALARRGLARVDAEGVALTAEGERAAGQIVRKHRLWEVYLSSRLELAEDRVHRDAEQMEHALTDRAVEELDRKLGYPQQDPHGRVIPRAATSAAKRGGGRPALGEPGATSAPTGEEARP